MNQVNQRFFIWFRFSNLVSSKLDTKLGVKKGMTLDDRDSDGRLDGQLPNINAHSNPLSPSKEL